MAELFFDETEYVKRDFVFAVGPASEESQEVPQQEVRFSIYGWENPIKGDIIWRGAWTLAEELAHRGTTLQGKRVLELGAGCGLLAAVAAHLGAKALATDGDEGEMPMLNRNAELFGDSLGLGGLQAASFLSWGTKNAEAAHEAAVKGAADAEGVPLLVRDGFDLVVGSDIAYMPVHIPELAETIAFFLHPDGEAIIVNTAVSTTANRTETEKLFCDALQKNGLDFSKVEPSRHPKAWPAGSYILRITRKLASATSLVGLQGAS